MDTVTLDPDKFSIKTDAFEGPLELLIELVEKRKLLINDINLAAVTDEYMRTISEMQELSLPNTSQFVSLAATLLLIKSKSLLPVLELTEEEEASIDDLEERLKKYQVYRDIAMVLQTRFGTSNSYEPEYQPPKEPVFMPDEHCQTSVLTEAMRSVLTQLPKDEPKPAARVRPTVSLESMITKLQNRIEQRMRTRFSELRSTETEHKNVIVGFLAILELFKQGNIIITQEGRFTDIELELERQQTPRYY